MNRTRYIKFAILVLVILLLGIGAVIATDKPDPKPQQTVKTPSGPTVYQYDPAFSRPTAQHLLDAVNAERAKVGVAPLVMDERLNRSAQAKACDQRDNDYNGHLNPTTGIRGIEYAKKEMNHEKGHYGENITQPTPVTENQAMTNWINSPPHHAAMIDSNLILTGFGICGNKLVEHFYGP